MLSPHVLQLADCIAPVLVNGFGVFLEDARRGMAAHLGYKEIGYPCSAQATGECMAQIVNPEVFNSCVLQRGSSYTKPRRTMSAAGRRRISLAQKVRWAKRAALNGNAARPKRKMSAAARRKIAAGQRARWAKVRKQQKKAA
jgi:hypothetical protein